MKYITLTMFLVLEFFILATFSVKPIELSFMFWLATVMLFEVWDLIKENEKKTPSAN